MFFQVVLYTLPIKSKSGDLRIDIPGGRVEVRKNNKQQGVWCCAREHTRKMLNTVGKRERPNCTVSHDAADA